MGMHISAERNTRCNMNIKKTIGISMIALLVVAMGAGMAAAGGWDANPIAFDLPDDGVKDDAFTITWTPGTMNATWVILDPATGSPTNDIEIRTGAEAYASASTGDVAYSSSGISYDVKDVTGTVGDTYWIRFTNSTTQQELGTQIVTVTVTVIPEFATIAIPVVALLGLVLFMRRKKD